MKRLLFLLLCYVSYPATSIAQLPDCNKLYILIDKNIYAYDPAVPVSASNPSLNTHKLPANGEGLAICPPLKTSNTVPTFYINDNWKYSYSNGVNWINTGHASSSVNTAAGGKYIYNLDGGGGKVYRYDGTSEIFLTNVPPFVTPYDLIADCESNWYLLNTNEPNSFLRQYDSTGNLTRSWVLDNPKQFRGNGGFGILGNTIYFDLQYPYSGIGQGIITADTVFIDTTVISFPALNRLTFASDFATCASGINLNTRIRITADQNNICAGTPVTFRSTTVNSTGSATYQWRVNGVNAGTNNSTFTYTPVNGDIVSCILTNPGTCSGFSKAPSNMITMVTNNIPIIPIVTITNLKQGFCIDSISSLMATTGNIGTPSFQWIKNGVMAGANSIYTDPTLANGDRLYVIMTITNGQCVVPAPVTSDTITVTLGRPVVTGINLNAVPPNMLCNGAPVTFISNHVGGGPRPSYKWYKNGALLAGINTPTYTDNQLNDGDTLMVALVSSLACPIRKEMPSNKLGVTVHPVVTPALTITAHPGTTIISNQYITFTATTTNGGNNPGFQWFKNGMLIPNELGITFSTNSLQHGDRISARMESHAPCAIPVFAASNVLTLQNQGTAIGEAALSTEHLLLYPNPNTGTFNLALHPSVNGQALYLEVFSATGQSVLKQDIKSVTGQDVKKISLDKVLADGYYVLKLYTGKGVRSMPFILRR